MEKLKLEDFFKYKFVSNLLFSPNSNLLGFVVHQMNPEQNDYISKIWVYDFETETLKQLTNFGKESSFIWFDEKTILFPSIREEKDKKRKEAGEPFTAYYKICVDGGEAEKVFEISLNVKQIEKIDQKKFVLTAVYDPRTANFVNLEEKEKEKALKQLKEEKDYEVVDEIPFWSNGSGFTNKKRVRLYIFDSSNGNLLPLTDELTNVEHFSLSQDKRKILFICNRFESKMSVRSDLYLYTVDDGMLSKLTHEDPFDYTYAFFLKDKIIFAGTNMKRYGINENPRFYLLDPETKQVELLTADFDLSLHNSVNSDCRYGSSKNAKVDGDYLYFVTTEWSSSHLNRIDVTGKIEKLTNKSGSVDGLDVQNGKIVFVGMRDLKLQEIYLLSNGKEIQLTFLNEWVVKERTLSKPERFTYCSKDGVLLEGWIMRPIDFEPSKKYPTILNIHGGPKTVYGESFFHEMQVWANMGYVVIYTNPRGSDGRGNEFADIRGKYGTIDYEDLMTFVDEAIKRYPFIDEQRLGVTGGSYGGFMTNWIIGHTDRFRAAVSQRSIANWISKFGTTDIGYFFVEDQHLATPWSDYEKLWWHSPMKYADRVKTPTLFIHSDEDYRCWLVEAVQMFTSLKYHGVESRLVIFKGENHELSRSGKPKHRLRRLEEITGWFEKHLK